MASGSGAGPRSRAMSTISAWRRAEKTYAARVGSLILARSYGGQWDRCRVNKAMRSPRINQPQSMPSRPGCVAVSWRWCWTLCWRSATRWFGQRVGVVEVEFSEQLLDGRASALCLLACQQPRQVLLRDGTAGDTAVALGLVGSSSREAPRIGWVGRPSRRCPTGVSGLGSEGRVTREPSTGLQRPRADDRCSDRPDLAVFQESGAKGCMRAMSTATSSGSAGRRSL